jgi:transcription initiation factor IIE alpha subunit
MNHLNTLVSASTSALTEALFLLETLSDPLSVPILDFLLRHTEATLLDLLIATGIDTETLEMQLELLVQTKAVTKYADWYNAYYQIEIPQIKKVKAIATKLALKR